MKNKLFILFCGISIFFITCKDEIPFEPLLSVNPSVLNAFDSDGGEQMLVVQSNMEWTASSSSDWIVINPSSGDAETKSMTVSALPNETYDGREGMIVFRNSQYNMADTVYFSQVQKDAIVMAQNVYEISYIGGELIFNVSSNVDFTISLPTWIKLPESRGLKEKEVAFNVDENEELESREGQIIFKHGDIEQKVQVIQGGYEDTIERNALIALYKATDGDNWTNNTNWCTDKPLNEWYGISVDEKSRVIYISLIANNLNGVLPVDLEKLSKLKSLRMDHNLELSGPIPKELGNLNNLESLSFYVGGLTDSIPKELGNLSKLRTLNLFRNKLSGSIPTELGNLTCLEFLDLSDNELTGSIPSSLGNLSNLESLHLDFTALTGAIPKELGNLSNLKTLCLYYIGYKGGLTGEIPKELGNLSKLENLWLNANDLSGSIPVELGNLKNLKSLNLAGNELSGPIPSELGLLVNLTSLRLSGNELSGEVPAELGELKKMEDFALQMNQLSGPIPEFIGQMNSYGNVWLYDNQFSGDIPEKIISHIDWNVYWPNFISRTNVNLENVSIGAPEFEVIDMSGNTINSDELYVKNKLTILLSWDWSCRSYIKMLNELYQTYHSKGLDILSCNYIETGYINVSTQDVDEYIKQNIPWNNFIWTYKDESKGTEDNYIKQFTMGSLSEPGVIVVDNDKQVVFQNFTDDKNGLSLFLSDYFNSVPMD